MESVRVSLVAVGLLSLFVPVPAAQHFADWDVPVNLGAVNSEFADQAPAVSKDGLSLYFQSDRPGYGNTDLWVSRRDNEDEPWGEAVNLGEIINSTAFESRPSLSRDGHWLFFSSTRPGGLPGGGLDLWASYREHVHDDFAWQTPTHLGPGVNRGGSSEIEASYVENESGAPQLYFASNRPGGFGAFDIYVSELLTNGEWGPATFVPELSSATPDASVSVRFDGREAIIVRGNPPLPAGFDLWVSTRETTSDLWSAPVNLGPVVNTLVGDESAHISADRQTLYFESNRPGGSGRIDLWMTTRTKRGPQRR
jgi:hypothetical protein